MQVLQGREILIKACGLLKSEETISVDHLFLFLTTNVTDSL